MAKHRRRHTRGALKRTGSSPVECVADWPRWALDKLIDLINAGIPLSTARATVLEFLASARDNIEAESRSGA